MIRVLVVDDHDLVRAEFVTLVNSAEGLEVVGEARSGEEALSLAKSEEPDVLLMDIQMPGMGGLAATKALYTQSHGRAKVLMLTTFDLDEYEAEAFRSGASGFLLKDTPPSEILRAIRQVASGETPERTTRESPATSRRYESAPK